MWLLSLYTSTLPTMLGQVPFAQNHGLGSTTVTPYRDIAVVTIERRFGSRTASCVAVLQARTSLRWVETHSGMSIFGFGVSRMRATLVLASTSGRTAWTQPLVQILSASPFSAGVASARELITTMAGRSCAMRCIDISRQAWHSVYSRPRRDELMSTFAGEHALFVMTSSRQ